MPNQPISLDDLRSQLADEPDRLLQLAYLIQAKIDWLSAHENEANDPDAAAEELTRCHAWSRALAAGDLGQGPSARDDAALLDAIAQLDRATAQNAGIVAVATAVDGLIQAFKAPG